MLKEVKRLYDLGFGVHYLKPSSKVPLGEWNTVSRQSFDELKKTFNPTYNLGVRLGQASKIGNRYLAAFDVDIKSKNPKHLEEALSWFKKFLPQIGYTPYDLSGRGNGSRHYLVTVPTPQPSWKLVSSPEMVEVKMPSVKPTKHQIKILGEEKVKAGWRLRPAWEIEFMCMGKQIAIPPSTHPDTGQPYVWGLSFERADEILELSEEDLFILQEKKVSKEKEVNRDVHLEKFIPEDVELRESGLRDDAIEAIESGEGVEDRSAALMSICMKMLNREFSDNQILSVLTDRNHFLGNAAFDHAKTENRKRAAYWVLKYCLEPARYQLSALKAFEAEVIEDVLLSEEEFERQRVELCGSADWRDELSRTGGGDPEAPPKATMKNIILIMENTALGNQVVKRDLFSMREFYGCDTPWGGKEGDSITDDDFHRVKMYLADHFRFEPNINLISEAFITIALKNAFHPIREAHLAREEWDGVERLGTWLKRNFEAEGPDEYLNQTFTKWLVASVTRVFNPGAKFDWMPIFEGAQGVGKSSFGSMLFGQSYFSDWLPRLDDKDAALSLQGILCNEFAELSKVKMSEVEIVKAFITRQIDKVRPPYGRKQLELKRQCVFFGTTNAETFLRDETGNRRFVPIKVGQLNFKALKEEKEQLWAEAFFISRNGLYDSLELTGMAKEHANSVQKEKTIETESDLMKENLLLFFEVQKRVPKEEKIDLEKILLSDLFGVGVSGAFLGGAGATPPLKNWKYDARNIQFASRALKDLGFEKRKIEGVRYYKRVSGARTWPRK